MQFVVKFPLKQLDSSDSYGQWLSLLHDFTLAEGDHQFLGLSMMNNDNRSFRGMIPAFLLRFNPSSKNSAHQIIDRCELVGKRIRKTSLQILV